MYIWYEEINRHKENLIEIKQQGFSIKSKDEVVD